MKVHTTIVWHEFGHIFGYILVNKIYGDYRKIAEIILTKGNKNTQICTDNTEPIDTEKNELEMTILILIMGAVFHVRKFRENKNITISDFIKIFTNVEYELNTDSLRGHAGKDSFLIKYFIKQYNNVEVELSIIPKLALNLQNILKKHKMFEKIQSQINNFDINYNGKETVGKDLFENERKVIYKLISKNLIIDIQNIITDFTQQMKF